MACRKEPRLRLVHHTVDDSDAPQVRMKVASILLAAVARRSQEQRGETTDEIHACRNAARGTSAKTSTHGAMLPTNRRLP